MVGDPEKFDTFTPGYVCKVCNDSRIWDSLHDAVVHIKVIHTNEIGGKMFYRRREIRKGRVTVTVQQTSIKSMYFSCAKCGQFFKDRDALFRHRSIAISHQRCIAQSSHTQNSESHLTEGDVNGNVGNSKEDAVNIGKKNKHLDDHSYSHTFKHTFENESTETDCADTTEKKSADPNSDGRTGQLIYNRSYETVNSCKSRNSKRFKCSRCGYSCSDRDALLKHVAFSHTNVAFSHTNVAFPHTNAAISGSSGSQFKAKYSDPQNAKSQKSLEGETIKNAQSCKEDRKNGEPSRNQRNESGKRYKSRLTYHIVRPDLEDKWQYMFGEKGTFERLQSSHSYERHVGRYLCLYEDSEAFRKCFEYMEWNCKMKCIFCCQEFELFSDFVQHFFDENSCDKIISVHRKYACLPCMKRGMTKDQMIKHMLKFKSHGAKKAAFVPKPNDNDKMNHEKDSNQLESFTPGYRCKLCKDSRVWISLHDAVVHIKETHTKESQDSFVYRRRHFEKGKVTISLQEVHVKAIPVNRLYCSTCGSNYTDKDALIEHIASSHQNIAISRSQFKAKDSQPQSTKLQNLTESNVARTAESSKKTGKTKNSSRNTSSESGKKTKSGPAYEIHRPELEDKWEYMYGEKGTFERLRSSHSNERYITNGLCLYDDSEAFRKFSDYMEWNCHMRCIFCNRVFELFSDFIVHFFECDNSIRVPKNFACLPCGKQPLKRNELISHMIEVKTHGTKTAAFIPKSKEKDADWLESFNPGYRCKVCSGSIVMTSFRDAVSHIKREHTKEKDGSFIFRKRRFQQGKVTISVQEIQVRDGRFFCSTCGAICGDKNSLLAHYASFHKNVAFSGGRDNANNPNKDDERSQNVLECDGMDDNKEDKGKPNMEIELPGDETINPAENFSTERGLQRDCSDEKDLFEGNDPSANSGNMGNIQKLCSDSLVENSAASQRDDIQNEDTRQVKYEVVRKDLEDKWEFMYGEKGTFQRLQGSHLGKELCIYEESEAFRKCFDYMEWNCTMRCIFCSLEFDQLSDFMLHFFETYSCEKTIKENKKWVCQPCGKDKMSKPGFLRHLLKLKTHGSKTAAFKPKSTRDDPAGGRLKQDGLSSFTPGYRCKICKDSRIWVTLRDAVVHIKEVHTNEGPGNFMYRIRHFQKGKITVHANHKQKKLGPCLCSFCGKVCRSKYSLLAHLARYHKDVASDQVSRKQLVCPHCGKSFSIYHGNNFNRHLKTHTDPVTCEICGKVYSNENTYHVHRLTHYKKHTCACGKTYSSKDKFCCGKEYICACGKKFKTKQNYLQHDRGHRLNGQERQHKCDECGKSFLYKHHLKNHIASYHSTERKFKCGACGASFKLKHHLKQHLDSESACAASN